MKVRGDRVEQACLGAALHHVDERALSRSCCSIGSLKIVRYSVIASAFGNISAVLELEHGTCRPDPRQECAALVLALGCVDSDELDRR